MRRETRSLWLGWIAIGLCLAPGPAWASDHSSCPRQAHRSDAPDRSEEDTEHSRGRSCGQMDEEPEPDGGTTSHGDETVTRVGGPPTARFETAERASSDSGRRVDDIAPGPGSAFVSEVASAIKRAAGRAAPREARDEPTLIIDEAEPADEEAVADDGLPAAAATGLPLTGSPVSLWVRVGAGLIALGACLAFSARSTARREAANR